MEFADGSCYLCGKAFGNRKPKTVIKVEKPYSVPSSRLAEFVSPCPFCDQNVPLWAGEPTEPEPEAKGKGKKTEPAPEEAEVEPPALEE